MNIKILIILLFSINCYSQKYITKEMIGTYSYHHDEDTTGTVYITDKKVEINTSIVYYDIDLNKVKFRSKKHYLDIKFQTEEGEDVHIKLTLQDEDLILSVNNNVIGTFIKYKLDE